MDENIDPSESVEGILQVALEPFDVSSVKKRRLP
jgi:hypothetical protein